MSALLVRQLLRLGPTRVSRLGQVRFKSSAQKMEQVEVDEPNVQKQLGRIQMDMIRKAEDANKSRAARHVKYRKKDWYIGGICFAIAITIYSYTIYAIKQEKFLDDFEVPIPLPEQQAKELRGDK